MAFRTEKFITRAMLRAAPTTLFVFGDNMVRAGRGGQAAEMRGEPNAVGIPTKWAPSMRASAFFCDRDLSRVIAVALPLFQQLSRHLALGGDVVWPADGIGTGRAELAARAPALFGVLTGLQAALRTGVALQAVDQHPEQSGPQQGHDQAPGHEPTGA